MGGEKFMTLSYDEKKAICLVSGDPFVFTCLVVPLVNKYDQFVVIMKNGDVWKFPFTNLTQVLKEFRRICCRYVEFEDGTIHFYSASDHELS